MFSLLLAAWSYGDPAEEQAIKQARQAGPGLYRAFIQKALRHPDFPALKPMIVIHDYHGFRIKVEAVEADGRWNADVRLRRILTQDKPHLETVLRR